jgi:ankyrin repeat protein
MQESVETTFRNARNNNFETSDKNFSSLFRLTKIKPVDDYGNTLLHIGTEHSNEKYVEDLLNSNYDQDVKNKFGKSAWDIAITNQNKNIINKFVDHRVKTATSVVKERNELLQNEVSLLTKRKAVLETQVGEYCVRNKHLEDTLNQTKISTAKQTEEMTILTRSKTKLLSQIGTLEKSVNNLTSENSTLKFTNKRLREDNEELKDANKKLKSSVDALITASMK